MVAGNMYRKFSGVWIRGVLDMREDRHSDMLIAIFSTLEVK